MLKKITDALKGRSDLQAWTVRHVVSRGAQVYAVPKAVEARRAVGSERYEVVVLRHTPGPDGQPSCGTGDATLLPGDDIGAALDRAALAAGQSHNPVHGIPAPAPVPEVELADAVFQQDPVAAVSELMDNIRAAAAREKTARLTAAECFGDEYTIHLVNSRGVDAAQTATDFHVEMVLNVKKGERESEAFVEMGRRRIADYDVPALVGEGAQHALDSLNAAPPPTFEGAVVLNGDTLGLYVAGEGLSGGVLPTLASAASKYAKLSAWEVGQPIFKRAVVGDPFTVWANRRLPFGANSNRFDDDGLPAQRVELVKDNVLQTFTASQRYADYLKIPPTGAFGNAEVPPGRIPSAALRAEAHVEVAAFSWFNPNTITAEFATEIRLGYLVAKGKRTPFRGGLLVGNWLDALADMHWSAETGSFGNYFGPTTARFNRLKVG